MGPVLRELELLGARVILTSAMPDVVLKDHGGIDAIIAVGGDGTIRRLSQFAHDYPVGVVPAGTGNVLVREVSIPDSPAKIARTLMFGKVITLEGARANGEAFFLMAGAGFDGEIVARLPFKWKRRLGRAAYAFPTVRALRQPFVPFSVTVDDGSPFEADWVVATKARRYGGHFQIAPDVRLTDPGLSVIVMRAEQWQDRVRQLWGLSRGRLFEDKDVTVLRGRHIRVTSDEPVACQVDGDALGHTPLEIEDGGPKFKLIVPEEFEA